MRRLILFLMLCTISMSFHNIEIVRDLHVSKPLKVNKSDKTSFLKSEILNDSILYLALLHYDIKYPKAVLAQAKLESSNFKSQHYINRNNFLGLYNSKSKTYYRFSHWSECILAYKDMIEYKLREGEDYYQFLKRIKYASSPNYIDLVKEIEKQIQINDKGLVTSQNKCI